MAFLFAPTTSFEIILLDEIDVAIARLKIEKIACYHNFLQHKLYGG
jgi:hypothetical protein